MPPCCRTPTKEIYGCSISSGDLRRPWNIVQHDCGNVNDQRRLHRPRQRCGLPLKTESCYRRCSATQSATRLLRWRISVVTSSGLSRLIYPERSQLLCGSGEENGGTQRRSFSNAISVPSRRPITPFAPPAPRCSSCESPASGIGRARSIPQEQRSDKSERTRDYPSPGTLLW